MLSRLFSSSVALDGAQAAAAAILAFAVVLLARRQGVRLERDSSAASFRSSPWARSSPSCCAPPSAPPP
jgi:hypothetical protein